MDYWTLAWLAFGLTGVAGILSLSAILRGDSDDIVNRVFLMVLSLLLGVALVFMASDQGLA